MSILVIDKGEFMQIDQKYFRTETVYRNIGTNHKEGQIGCGFIHTVLEEDAKQKANLGHYGAFLVLHGEGTYIGENGEEFPLKQGCFVQRLPEISHTTIVHPGQDWLEFFVIFGSETYETLKQYVSVLKFVLFVYYSESHRNFGDENAKDYQKIELAGKMLCEDPGSHITGQMVADRLDIGYESFRKKFKSLYHISPNAYQLNYRINYAKTLLADNQKTLEEIAQICGFSDGFAFSKAFKKRCGISPEQFRKSI